MNFTPIKKKDITKKTKPHSPAVMVVRVQWVGAEYAQWPREKQGGPKGHEGAREESPGLRRRDRTHEVRPA